MRSLAFHFVLAFMLLLLSGGALFSAYLYIAKESTTAASLAATLSTKSAESEHASALALARTELGDDEELIDNYFISEQNIVPFLAALQAIGTGFGAEVTVNSVGADRVGKNLQVSLAINGPFDAVLRTVGGIEFAPYALTLSSLTMSNSAKTWSASLSLLAAQVQTGSSTPATSAPTESDVTPLTPTQPYIPVVPTQTASSSGSASRSQTVQKAP